MYNCKNVTVTVHICMVIVALHLIFYYFFLSPSPLALWCFSLSPLSLFLSLVPHSHSPIFEASFHWWTNKQATIELRRSKPCHWSPKQAHSCCATADCHPSSLVEARRRSSLRATTDHRWNSVWSVGIGVLILFNFLFGQFWDILFDQWVLGFWSF